MSEFLINNMIVVQYLVLIFEYGLLVLGLLYLYRVVRQEHFEKKIEQCEEQRNEARDDYLNSISQFGHELLTEDGDYSEKINDKRKEMEKSNETYNAKIQEYEKKSKKTKTRSNIIMSTIGVFLIVLLMLLNFGRSCIGGDISYIVPIENNVNQDIAITAYYEVEYEGVSQKTLTVFVRNDSQKILENAILKEKKSGNTVDVKTLEPGEEKIVSINVYSLTDSDYEFELLDINFKE